MEDITDFKTLSLDLRPDVVKLWPKNDQYAIAGTYTLIEDEPSKLEESTLQTRVGSLNLIHIADGDMKTIQTVPTPFGVYDLHFLPDGVLVDNHSDVFAVSSSTGSIALYYIRNEGDGTWDDPKIHHVRTIQIFTEDVLITSLAFHPGGRHVAMTLSDGRCCVAAFEPRPDSVMDIMQHDFQAWICSFVKHPDVNRERWGLVSGGDDAILRYTELDIDTESVSASEEPHIVSWIDRRVHQAGVTALLPIPQAPDNVSSSSTTDGFLIITGSYDDHIRLLHCPNVGKKTVLAEENLDGGVFRIKFVERTTRVDPYTGKTEQIYLLIVSCMQAGARIVKLCESEGAWYFKVEAKFEQNKGTLLYASDCQKSISNDQTIISTSFEDRKMFLWKWKAH